MIYDMVRQCVQNLVQSWDALHTELTELRAAINQVTPNAFTPTLDTQINTIQGHITNDLDNNPLEQNGAFANVQPMLANARTMLNGSRDLINPDGSNVLRTTSTALGTLLASQNTHPTVFAAASSAQTQLNNLQEFIDSCLIELEELTTEEGARANIGGINRAVENISAYPVLTQEASFTPSHRSYDVVGGGSRPLSVIAENVLRDVLGWRPKASDPKGFVAALAQSFTCKEVDGRSECVYSPRTYAMQVSADLGAITGAQASIYARAKSALEQSLSILDRLHSLGTDSDDEEADANRAIVRSLWSELVNELGTEGGPRVERVNALFDQLRGANNPSSDPDLVGGQLAELGNVFGLSATNVNTIDEEQDLTDFRTLVDYINSLHLSWLSQQRFFDRSSTAQPFLGTQLVHVSRALAVISESVYETYSAMDSVYLGASERQTIELVFSNRPPIFIAELLAWVDRFASEEAPLLIQDGGKAGVRALYPTLERLVSLTQSAQVPPQNPNRLPAAYRTARVQRSLQELTNHLSETLNLIRGFRTPAPAQTSSFGRSSILATP